MASGFSSTVNMGNLLVIRKLNYAFNTALVDDYLIYTVPVTRCAETARQTRVLHWQGGWIHGQTSCFDYIRSLSLYAGHSAFCANQGMGHLFTRVSGHAHCWVRFLPSATWFSFTCSREADHGIYCSPDTEMWTTSPLNRHKCSFRGGSLWLCRCVPNLSLQRFVTPSRLGYCLELHTTYIWKIISSLDLFQYIHS